jgi:anti-sigma28 factor (negative regulator of flagellin synthesis)
MKIGFEINKVINTYNQNSKATKINSKAHNFKDKIDISEEGREISKYVEIANNTELKNKRVDEIKSLIDQNKYEVDTKKLAESILKYIKESDS